LLHRTDQLEDVSYVGQEALLTLGPQSTEYQQQLAIAKSLMQRHKVLWEEIDEYDGGKQTAMAEGVVLATTF
jgi:ABC-type branched-subunit amino acid transport system ATPase component